MFGRAAIALGIGPHSSYSCYKQLMVLMMMMLLCQLYLFIEHACSSKTQNTRQTRAKDVVYQTNHLQAAEVISRQRRNGSVCC